MSEQSIGSYLKQWNFGRKLVAGSWEVRRLSRNGGGIRRMERLSNANLKRRYSVPKCDDLRVIFFRCLVPCSPPPATDSQPPKSGPVLCIESTKITYRRRWNVVTRLWVGNEKPDIDGLWAIFLYRHFGVI